MPVPFTQSDANRRLAAGINTQGTARMTMASIEARSERSVLERFGQISGGVALLGLGAFLALALATWNVSDPSLSQANGNPVTNLAGSPGAVVADLAMQIFGIASVLLAAVPALWGGLIAAGRGVDGLGRRGWFALGGTALAGAALGCFDAPAAWPLPIGLGGIVGDLLLKVPALLTGAYPSGTPGLVLGAALAIPAAWTFLLGAGVLGRRSRDLPLLSEERRAAGFVTGPEGEDDAPGRLQLLIGVLGHWTFSMRAALGRRFTPALQALAVRRDPDPFAGSWKDEAPAMKPAPEPRFKAAREIRVVERPSVEPARALAPERAERLRPAAFEPVAAEPDCVDDLVHAMAVVPQRRAVDTSRATVRLGRSDWNGSVALSRLGSERGGQPDAAGEPAFASEPYFADEAFDTEPEGAITDAPADEPFEGAPFEDAPFEHEEDVFEACEPEFQPAEAEADDGLILGGAKRLGARETEPVGEPGGWRGFLTGNIVAFPGLKARARGDAEPTAANTVVAPPVLPPVQPLVQPRADHSRTPPAPVEAPVRVVPQAAPAMARQSSRARLAELGRPGADDVFELPSIDLLSPPRARGVDATLSPEVLSDNARLLEGVLDDFGVKGEILEVRPGPVVTLYELEPAPGIKSSRVIGLADDIARSMSAIAARVAVIPGKNAIGIELPNQRRETVYLREMMASEHFTQSKSKLALTLGKTIGGEPVIADLAKMPHLLVAGTTGSGKSVAINTMILSLLYRMTPAECRMIMIDPKMLELSIYDGIPHLLSPVVTDPKKAVVALKWTVREMEDRYRKMSKVGVRNIDGFNQRVSQAIAKGEAISRTVQTGFDRETGEPIFESEEFDLQPLPYIVVIIDEMADLMMVAGKDIEGAVQRLAQMARAAGIHVIMATQRPSVDVITGTIKANFPTRISVQVTSKIDSRTILGEQGAEQLLGQGDMLFMAGGGRIQRVHGPFVDDTEVEGIVAHLKAQGTPDYLDAVLEDDEDGEAPSASGTGGAAAAPAGEGGADDGADLYDQAVAVVLRDGKASTSYVQRRLGIGYNRAASIIERMEKEGIVGPANHAGKREILVPMEEERA